MFRIAFLLGLVPGVMFTIALYSKPQAPTAPIIRAQKIEADDEVWPPLPIDAPAITPEAFNHRWGAVNEARYVPRENEVRYIPRDDPGVRGREAVADAVTGAQAPLQPRHRPKLKKTTRADVCARHKMRKVVTKGGKSWRCKK